MRISLGILAHDEERVVARTIESIAAQTLATRANDLGVELLELVIVPNGCRDNTVGAARAAQRRLESTYGASLMLTSRIHELDHAGKSAAWNRYVHEFSDSRADYLILIDADVRFGEDDTLQRLVQGLVDTPAAYASVDTPLKRLPSSSTPNLITRLSVAISGVPVPGMATIAGSLYCIRAEAARRIWMPVGLPVEDGFVKAMLMTEFFTRPERDDNWNRIIRVEGASHYFEPQVRIATALRHEQRMLVGAVVNGHLYSLLWAKGRETAVGEMIRDLNQQNPNWLRDFCNAEFEKEGYWLVPHGLLFRRLRELRRFRITHAIRLSPVAIAGAMLSLVASLPANQTLRSGDSVGFW